MNEILLFAIIIDYLIGWPNAIYQRIAHPTVWIGKAISYYEHWLNHEGLPGPIRQLYGIGLVIVLILGSWIIGNILQSVGWLVELAVVISMLAGKSLYDHVDAVRVALAQEGVEAGRDAVAKIVGRDTSAMDESQISRAAIESLAESTSDGLIAPIFGYVMAGLPGMLLFKAINTADSMVGYKTPRYQSFGWASARMDDVLNFIPARLTMLLYALAARSLQPVETALRDAKKHTSPNAGWPEAAMAGALGITLGGPVMRNGEMVEAAELGNGENSLNADHIQRALQLYRKLQINLLAIVALCWLFGPSPTTPPAEVAIPAPPPVD